MYDFLDRFGQSLSLYFNLKEKEELKKMTASLS
ncbi:hypothetical protein C7437_107124 [Psychrobacillus insolitus]|uniref:Uncharacterized protein n=1 Tax=Psychrobacillus insolitus TaxID=1461 RepID=A0A2W7MFQ9_9BACI|nr:hypothetical protein C7437_107124 [Psychrobacillus insolitus]